MKRFNPTVKSITAVVVCLLVILATVLTVADNYYGGLLTKSDYQDLDIIEFIDVGQGDCALVSSAGRIALIDAGTTHSSRTIIKELRQKGIREIDVLVISHMHDDHFGGAADIIRNISVKNVVMPCDYAKLNAEDSNICELKDAICESDCGYYTACEDMVINIGNFEMTVLQCGNDFGNENNNSSIISVEKLERTVLFTGDAEKEAENLFISKMGSFDCDVLKVGHHGSKTSSTQDFIDAVTPEYAIISVGEKNQYNLPSQNIVDRLNASDIEVYRTDTNGNIIIVFYDDSIKFDLEMEDVKNEKTGEVALTFVADGFNMGLWIRRSMRCGR